MLAARLPVRLMLFALVVLLGLVLARQPRVSLVASIATIRYESGGQEFESLRARQLAHCWHNYFIQYAAELLPRRVRRGSTVEAKIDSLLANSIRKIGR